MITSIATADLDCKSCSSCPAGAGGTDITAASASMEGCAAWLLCFDEVVGALNTWCVDADAPMLLLVATGSETSCCALLCWSAAVLSLQPEDVSCSVEPHKISGSTGVLLGYCWRVSVLFCCTGLALDAGLPVAADATSEVLRVCPGVPVMLHRRGSVTTDITLDNATLSFQAAKCLCLVQ